MPDANDWRLTNQIQYLRGVTLQWKVYEAPSEAWDHDHCEFCWAKFMNDDSPEVQRAGYSTEDRYRWICRSCFEDFRKMFQWNVASEKD